MTQTPPNYQQDTALTEKRQQLAQARATLPALEYTERQRREDLDRLQLASERLAALASVNRAGKKAAAHAATVADDAKRVWAAASADAEDCRALIAQLTREIPAVEADARRRGLEQAEADLRDLLAALFGSPFTEAPERLDAVEAYRADLFDLYANKDTAHAVSGGPVYSIIADAPATLRELITVSGFAGCLFNRAVWRKLERLIKLAQAAKLA